MNQPAPSHAPSDPSSDVFVPPVISVRRDAIFREIRLELADWRTRTGGVYDLSPEQWALIAVPGHLPPHHLFVPDFVIVYATGHVEDEDGIEDADQKPIWTDLRVHAGGYPLTYAENANMRTAFTDAIATDWHNLDALLNGTYRSDPAPGWLLALIADHTPFGHLLFDRPTTSGTGDTP